MYPTLIVFVGYLAADIFLDGYIAALAVFSLGSGEFLFLQLFRKKKHPALILEGAVLASAGLAGDMLGDRGYSGAGYVILELILAGVLLVSTARGKPWLASQMKRFSGFSTDREFSGEMSMVMGLLFLTHGVFLTIMIVLQGRIPVLPAIFSFVVFYAIVFFILRRKQMEKNIRNEPHLLKSDEEKLILELSGEKIGSMVLKPGSVSIVTEVEIAENCEVYEFLEILEKCLKHQGCRAVRFAAWDGDELHLEMSGYQNTPSGWNKIL